MDYFDIHAHFWPPSDEQQTQRRYAAFRSGCFMVHDHSQVSWDPATTIKHLDATNTQMQFLSNLPPQLDALRMSNDYGAQLVREYPTRFGLLAAMPTDDPTACLEEIRRMGDVADGFAVTTQYNGVSVSDPSLNAVWDEWNRRGSVVFMHPNAYAPATDGRPSPVIEVGFDTARTCVDLLYRGHMHRYPDVTLVVAHCGGALPAFGSRLLTLGCESWIPHDSELTPELIKHDLARFWMDTAGNMAAGGHFQAALEMTKADGSQFVYGSDWGVPCTTERTVEEGRKSLAIFSGLDEKQKGAIRRRALDIFPKAQARLHSSKA